MIFGAIHSDVYSMFDSTPKKNLNYKFNYACVRYDIDMKAHILGRLITVKTQFFLSKTNV